MLVFGAVALAAAQGEEPPHGNGQLQVPAVGFQAAVSAAAAPVGLSGAGPGPVDIASVLHQLLRGQQELRAVADNIPRRMRNSRVCDGAAVLRPLCRERVRRTSV